MSRLINVHHRAEAHSRLAAMVDGGIAQVPAEMGQQHLIPQHVITSADVQLSFDQAAGWPPKLARASKEQCLRPARADVTFDLAAQRACRDAVLRHCDVVAHLAGRWETLGVHMEAQRPGPCDAAVQARVCLYNYTTNQLIDVAVADGVVKKIRLGEPYEHSESPTEMAQAIALASVHPKIRDKVAGLAAHAILRVPMDAGSPAYRHRCLLVMFTEANDIHRELPVVFSALVDLCDQQILACGDCPCDFERSHVERAETE